MAKRVKIRWNMAGFAELRIHPKLVAGMTQAAESGAAGTSFDVDVVVFPHAGRRSGPRTSVQVWARHPKARAAVDRNPGALTATLGRSRV